VLGGPDGDDGLLLPHAAARVAIPTRTYLFMFFAPCNRCTCPCCS